MEDLELFYASWCPYCLRVLRFMEDNGIELAMADTDKPEEKRRLVEMGGKGQVPALRIGEKIMYESGDIIAYLNQRFNAA